MKFPRGDSGLSLVETGVAIAMIGIILSVMIPNVLDYYEEARKARAQDEMNSLARAVARYRLEEGWWPEKWYDMTAAVRKNRPFLPSDMASTRTGTSEMSVHPMDPWTGFYTLRAYIVNDDYRFGAVGFVPVTYEEWQSQGLKLLNGIKVAENTAFEVVIMSTSQEYNGVDADLGIGSLGSYEDELAVVGGKKAAFAGLEPSVLR